MSIIGDTESEEERRFSGILRFIFYKSNALRIKSIHVFKTKKINYVVSDHMSIIADQSGNRWLISE